MRESLTQSAGLPYARIMLEHLPSNSFLYYLTLEKESLRLTSEEKEALKKELTQERIIWIDYPYDRFGLKMAFKWLKMIPSLHRTCKKDNIQLLIALGPVAGAIVEILHQTTGIPYFVDGYEPHARSMVENGTWASKGIAFKLLRWFEKKQTKNAFALIATSDKMLDYAEEEYGLEPKQFFVKRACVDLDMFQIQEPDPALSRHHGTEKNVTCVYAGKLGGIYLKQEVFDFWKVCDDYWEGKFKVLMLTDSPRSQVEELAIQAGLSTSKIDSMFVNHDEVPKYMNLAHFAINPVKPVPSKRYCTSVKDGEYWACGLPVVIPANIADDSDLIEEHGIGAVLHGFQYEDYLKAAKAIDKIIERSKSEDVSKKIRALAVENRSFELAHNIYQSILQGLKD
ncbi:MAG: glycosyltransferase [Bacteroidota bacterium]